MRALAKTPSVLGGYRPEVRDAGRDAFQRVQYLKAEVSKAQEKLDRADAQLAYAEEERNSMRKECRKCGDCSACIG